MTNKSNKPKKLIQISYRKKGEDEATDDSEVMASEDDKNPDGAQSNEDKDYRVYIDPEIIEEMRRLRSRKVVVYQGKRGRIVIRYE